MSQKSAKLARKVAVKFGINSRGLKTGGDGLPAKFKASAYRKMRAVLKRPHDASKVMDKFVEEWTPSKP